MCPQLEARKALAFLKTVRAAAKPESSVILIEHVVPESGGGSFSKWMDPAMLVLTGGQKRTTPEYRQLLAQAGF